MKSLIIIMSIVAFASLAHAQSPLPVEISYDAAGNRITRKVLQVTMMSKGSNCADSTYYLDQMQSVRMKIYPNPTQGKVFIEMLEVEANTRSRIRLFDSSGRLVYEKESTGCANELDLSAYPAGYYIAEMHANGEHTTWKIIKK